MNQDEFYRRRLEFDREIDRARRAVTEAQHRLKTAMEGRESLIIAWAYRHQPLGPGTPASH